MRRAISDNLKILGRGKKVWAPFRYLPKSRAPSYILLFPHQVLDYSLPNNIANTATGLFLSRWQFSSSSLFFYSLLSICIGIPLGKNTVMSYSKSNDFDDSSTGRNLSFSRSVATATVTDSMANGAPRHIRGPAPKGTHEYLCFASSSTSEACSNEKM